MVKNITLQFDKDSYNSKIEVVQNVNKCPQLSHMNAESSHKRRRVVLRRLCPGQIVYEPNRLAFVLVLHVVMLWFNHGLICI